jgi:hypothetical protein
VALNAQGWRPAPSARAISILVPPGTYTVKLTVDGKDYTQPLKVLKDPHSNGTEGDIQIQNKLTTSLFDTLNHVVDEVNEIESLRSQILELKSAVGTDQSSAPVRTAADELDGKLIEVEEKLIQLKLTGRGQDNWRFTPMLAQKIDYLEAEVEGNDFKPTTQEVAVHDELKEQEATYRQRLALLVQKEVAAFNTLLRQRDIPNLIANK